MLTKDYTLKQRFVITLKTPIRLVIPRVDGSDLIVKPMTLLADWPCRFSPSSDPAEIEPREDTQINLTVIRFAEDGKASWYEHWKTSDGLTGPMAVQVKRDNILSRQLYAEPVVTSR